MKKKIDNNIKEVIKRKIGIINSGNLRNAGRKKDEISKLISTPTIKSKEKKVINKKDNEPIKRIHNSDTNKNNISKSDDKLMRRIYGGDKKNINKSRVFSSRFEAKTGIKKKERKNQEYETIDYGEYIKKLKVDFDTVIYISSFNRYNKIKNILSQLYSQKTKYSFKIILMNDGSFEGDYNGLKEEYPEMTYLKNQTNGGKKFYWRTKNIIWNIVKKYETHAIIQIDDDFILCDSFIDNVMDEFFTMKEISNTYMGVRYHYGHRDINFEFDEEYWDRTKYFHGFDGGSVFDPQFMEMFDYKIDEIPQENFKDSGAHSYVWSSLNDLLIKYGVLVHKTKNSLAWHDGNLDSKMHPKIRLVRKVHTKNFLKEDGI